jgi:hypothetical protein
VISVISTTSFAAIIYARNTFGKYVNSTGGGKISGSHGSEYEDDCLLRYCVM